MSGQEVLVVDDDPDRGEETATRLSERIDAACSATDPDAAVERLGDGVDCVVLAAASPAVLDHGASPPTVLFSDGGTGAAARALDAGVDDYCPRDGEEEQYDVLARTVTTAMDRRRKEREHERDVETYRTIVEAAGDAMYALDEEGYITMVNQSHAELSGHPREELVGSHVTEFMREEDVRTGTEEILAVLSDPDRSRGRFELRGEGLYPGDEERFFEDILAPITDEDGGYAGSVGVIRDVTERKHRERELRRQNERLDEFASVVAHDLRTPLASALGRLELRADRDDDALDDARQSLERMQRMIDDLLTLARQGRTVDDPAPVRFVGTVTDAWPGDDAATLTVSDPPERILADRARLTQLLENLFRNAVEHGSTNDQRSPNAGDAAERGGPDVEVTVGALDAEGDEARGFFVADDGPGIPPEDRQDAFEHGFTTREDGSGFGLAIVNRIAGAHDWSVEVVESESGGARFEVRGVHTPVEATTQ